MYFSRLLKKIRSWYEKCLGLKINEEKRKPLLKCPGSTPNLPSASCSSALEFFVGETSFFAPRQTSLPRPEAFEEAVSHGDRGKCHNPRPGCLLPALGLPLILPMALGKTFPSHKSQSVSAQRGSLVQNSSSNQNFHSLPSSWLGKRSGKRK